MRWTKLILFLVLIGLVFWWTLPQKPPQNWETAEVVVIKDGDSLVARQGNQEIELRLIGIDAAEHGEAYAEEARSFLANAIPPGSVIYFTQENELLDAYQRRLVVVYTEPERPFEESLNARLVSQGLALVPDYPDPTMYYQELKQLEQQAKEKKLGIHRDS